jgi:hypothetical protein
LPRQNAVSTGVSARPVVQAVASTGSAVLAFWPPPHAESMMQPNTTSAAGNRLPQWFWFMFALQDAT